MENVIKCRSLHPQETASVKRAKRFLQGKLESILSSSKLPGQFSARNLKRKSIDFSTPKKISKVPSRNSIILASGPNSTRKLDNPFNIPDHLIQLDLYIEKKSISDNLTSFITPEIALKKYCTQLSVFEQKEIKRFKKIYYLKITNKLSNNVLTNKEGNYVFEIGDHICYRYEILELIAVGCFGQVVRCLDHKTKSEIAIKILKKTHTSKKQGLTEYKIINLLQSSDNPSIVKVIRKFEFRFHFFIVFELLGVDLHHFIHLNGYHPISLSLVKRIAIQLLSGLAHMHSLNIIHCDLKPENIAFRNSNKSSIRIIDFGSSCFADTIIFNYIQSRFYRSPEVLLQCGKYDSAIDIWSLGCIILELLLGEPVFKGKSEEKVVKSIVRVLGFPPSHIVEMAKAKNLLSRCYERSTLSFHNILNKYNQPVIDFIESCLKWDPSQRITAQQGLNSKWFKPSHTRVKSMEYYRSE